jgi:histidinol-phosphate aminotransferase
MGGAGLRLGYGLMAPALAKNLNKVKLPYSVNVFTLTAAEVLVKRWDVFKGWIDRIVAERERLFAEFQRLPGVQVHPSRANFLLVEALTMPASVLFSRLLERGILIRDVSSYPMLKRGVRISVGTPKENDELLSALKEVL